MADHNPCSYIHGLPAEWCPCAPVPNTSSRCWMTIAEHPRDVRRYQVICDPTSLYYLSVHEEEAVRNGAQFKVVTLAFRLKV